MEEAADPQEMETGAKATVERFSLLVGFGLNLAVHLLVLCLGMVFWLLVFGEGRRNETSVGDEFVAFFLLGLGAVGVVANATILLWLKRSTVPGTKQVPLWRAAVSAGAFAPLSVPTSVLLTMLVFGTSAQTGSLLVESIVVWVLYVAAATLPPFAPRFRELNSS